MSNKSFNFGPAEMEIRVYDIIWDTDGVNPEEIGLPKEYVIKLDYKASEEEIETEIEIFFCHFDWLVINYRYEILK